MMKTGKKSSAYPNIVSFKYNMTKKVKSRIELIRIWLNKIAIPYMTGFSLLGGWGEFMPIANNLLILQLNKFPQ